jgi:hypothetical protein
MGADNNANQPGAATNPAVDDDPLGMPATPDSPATGERVAPPDEAGKAEDHLPTELPPDPGSAASDIQSGSGVRTTDAQGG